MRILQVITRSEPGGAQGVVRHLSEGLVAAGHEVAIAFGPEGGGSAWLGIDSRVELILVPGLVRRPSLFRELQTLISLSALYRSWKPSILHLHTSKAAALGRLAPNMDHRRIVYTMHGYDQIKKSNPAFLPFDKLLAARTAAIVAVSKADQIAMVADGYPRVSVIFNGVPEQMGKADSAIQEKVEDLRSRALPLIFVIARDAVPKRLDLACSVAASLQDRALFVWIGNSVPRPPGPGIVFLGPVLNAPSLLKTGDMFFLPSDHEGLPLSVLEAMARGVPAVASAVGGVVELLSNGGVVAVPNESEAIAGTLRTLLESQELRERTGKEGRLNWAMRYSSTAMVREYIIIYSGLAQARGVRSVRADS
ncbi:MAG: glycosyltransferase [Rectinemataceae bacterium]